VADYGGQIAQEKMARTVIHVNQHIIRSNYKKGERHPVLTVKSKGSNIYAHEAVINGPCRIVYSPDKPLPCGARVWIETESAVTLNVEEDREDQRQDQGVEACQSQRVAAESQELEDAP
jgi:hypothetical protein